MRNSFLFAALLGLLFAGSAWAGDVQLADVDVNGVKCGGCPGVVKVDLFNKGSRLSSSYTVWVELRVSPQARPGQSKTYKERLRGGMRENERKSVTFRDIKINSCNQEASVFVAKVYVTGGNYRDPNTRNNEKKVAQPVRNRCPKGNSGSGHGGSGHGGSGYGGSSNVSLPDLYPTSFRPSSRMCCGGKHDLKVPVRNKGRETVKSPVKVKLVVSAPGSRDRTYEAEVSRMLPNRNQNFWFRDVEFDTCGEYYSFQLMVDPENKIAESNEKNNSAAPRVRLSTPCE